MTIMTMKTKLVHYFLDILSIFHVAFAFDPRRVDGLHDYLRIYLIVYI